MNKPRIKLVRGWWVCAMSAGADICSYQDRTPALAYAGWSKFRTINA